MELNADIKKTVIASIGDVSKFDPKSQEFLTELAEHLATEMALCKSATDEGERMRHARNIEHLEGRATTEIAIKLIHLDSAVKKTLLSCIKIMVKAALASIGVPIV